MPNYFDKKSTLQFYKTVDGNSCHFNSPCGGGGPGGFMQVEPLGLDYNSNDLPHPNSPAARYLTPEQIKEHFVFKSPTIITTALLKAADATNTNKYYDSIIEIMNHNAQIYAVNTPLRIAHFLAQISHESGFKMVEESGNYSAKRMREIFGCKGGSKNYIAAKDECTLGRLRNKLWIEEAKYSHNPKNLLNYVYSLRMGNGNEASGDGYRFRGRGMMQITGKHNYQAFTIMHNKKNPNDTQDFVEKPELLKESKYSVESAFFYWESHNINAIADIDNVKNVSIAVNGGNPNDINYEPNGLHDRKVRLLRIKEELGI